MKFEKRSLRDRILHCLKQPRYQPLDVVDLSKALRIDSDNRREVRETLHAMEQEGVIARIRKDRYVLPDIANLATGVLLVHQNGAAHLENEKRDQPDIYISAADTGVAMRGDKVVVQLLHEGRQQARDGKARLEGRVIRILERANKTVVGVFQISAKGVVCVVPDDGRIQHDIYLLPAHKHAARPGDKVVVKLDPWEDRMANPEGEIIEVLGPAAAPGVDMLSIMRKYALPIEFPEDVLKEASRIPGEIDESEAFRREDLRGQPVITIDPDDARDFDDAIHVERIKGGWRLGVHIADVSHYVRPGSALDREARKRGNSTYLVDRVIPMLPERLSNGICSLKPGGDRLTFSAFIDFSQDGRIKFARFARTVIRSAARLSYRQALAILNGARTMPPLPAAMEHEAARGQATIADGPEIPIDPAIAERVRVAWELALALRKSRFAAGSLDLDFPEVKVWLDGEGHAVRIEKMVNDISHQLVEECMLSANEVVAREIKQKRSPGVYRIHEDPDPKRLLEFRDFAATYGFRAGDLTQRREVQKLLASVQGAPEEFAIKLGFLKSLKRAAYHIDPLGHYGLAKQNYAHFTSPIRRYADLLVHRTLADIVSPPTMRPGEKQLHRAQPEGVAELASTARHISETERSSADAEKDSVHLKKMEFFERQISAKKPQPFQASVVDVRSYGLFIELPSINVSGLIHVSDLADDFYFFDPVRLTFTGRKTRRMYKVGDSLEVIVSRVDVRKRQIDFMPVAEPRARQQARPGRRGSGPQRGRVTRRKE